MKEIRDLQYDIGDRSKTIRHSLGMSSLSTSFLTVTEKRLCALEPRLRSLLSGDGGSVGYSALYVARL